MSTQVILLERIEKLGNMGDVVNVRPGFARNYLLPQNKALRATKDNIAYFEAQKGQLEKQNADLKQKAEKQAQKLEGMKVALIRQASESGQLYGSVTSRDIAEALVKESGEAVTRQMVSINRNFKTIGLLPVDIALHPEVKTTIIINIARSEDEAKIQAKTGKALIAENQEEPQEQETATKETPQEAEKAKAEESKGAEEEADARTAAEEADKAAFLEESALSAEKEKQAQEAEKQKEQDAKAKVKAEKKAEKKAQEEAAKAEEEAKAESEAESGAGAEAKDESEAAGAGPEAKN